MKVTFYGTRGSVPIANPNAVHYGGNTTCLRVESNCLPDGMVLAVDAGTGFIPLTQDALKKSNVKEVNVLFTHWHHDHTQGLPLSPFALMKHIPMTCWGPVEQGYGPREVIEQIMKPPFFPVSFAKVGSHFSSRKIENPDSRVMVCHRQGGLTMMTVETYERGNGMVSFGKDGKYPREECLVIRMLYSNHPERTISYRFEENTSGKVFVFLTDHENQDALPRDMRSHLENADLLVMDSQYPREKYETMTAGFGHGTPGFCVRTALEVNAKQLGLTHHDPLSADEDVESIHAEAITEYRKVVEGMTPNPSLMEENIFPCRDYQEVDLCTSVPL